MRLASSRVSKLAADRRPGSSSEIEIAECVAGGVAHDVAGVMLVNGPRRREVVAGVVDIVMRHPTPTRAVILGQRFPIV